MTFSRTSRCRRRWAAAGSQLAVTAFLMVLAAGCAGSGTAGASAQQVSHTGSRPTATPVPAWHLKALARKYLAVATPANHRLDTANDGFTESEHSDLAAAQADLKSEAATEHWFDRHLAKISFPPAIEAIVRSLIEANQNRIRLTDIQSKSESLSQLKSFDEAHRGTDEAVENEVKLLRKALRLPPPSDS